MHTEKVKILQTLPVFRSEQDKECEDSLREFT